MQGLGQCLEVILGAEMAVQGVDVLLPVAVIRSEIDREFRQLFRDGGDPDLRSRLAAAATPRAPRREDTNSSEAHILNVI